MNKLLRFARMSLSVIRILFGSVLLLSSLVNAHSQVGSLGTSVMVTQTNTITGFTVPAGTNRILLVTASDGGTININSVTFNGTPLIKARQVADGFACDAIFVLALGSSASATSGNIVVVSSTASHTAKIISARVFQRVNQSDPLPAASFRTAQNSVTPSVSTLNVPSASGDLVFDIFDSWHNVSGGVRTPGAGQTVTNNSGSVNFGAGNGFGNYSTSTKPGAASVSMAWTTDVHSALIHIAFNIQSSGIVVPVTLLSFTAQYGEENVLLRWETADAVNFSHFEVERSADARQFAPIGSKPSVESANKVQYEYIDQQPAAAYQNPEKLYYRLKLVDKDSSFRYSKTVEITPGRNNRSLELSAYPTIFSDKVYLDGSFPATGNLTLRLSDMTGRTILTRQLSTVNGKLIYTLEDLGRLQKGTYLLQVIQGKEVISRKLLK
ncbi:T9SS type A sorting domain-containing protein [Terrimonas sp. NA20]|uniref:T9SS type A sorting domain-containing protein n=1 Tax=Terrimonas ginsenosidimutans TaxID=2908004 RepID=A0ABS9KS48_9BACT|nr:T9SS type A sorting domain-containing protein [Terrimonas ginsenosidimutans]MCG2615154.1 T9SS type A sorting domain-containing protein [Terrimonas ginsenosidimutans]